jgi:pimeloyl-ACP methyl ester carboxylesterase
VESLTRTVDTGIARVHLREWGDERAPALLFWHGLGGTGADLDTAGPLLAETYGLRVLAPDAPGVGASPALPTPAGYTSEASATQAAGLLDALGVERAIFLGHSWGATVGCYLAARHAGRVRALVLLDGGYLDLGDLGWASAPPSYQQLVELVRSGDAKARLAHTTAEVWAAVVDAGFGQPPSLALGDIPRDLPVLVVAATEPPGMQQMRDERLARFRAAVPQAAVESIPGVSHNLLAEAGSAVATVVGDWLTRALERK